MTFLVEKPTGNGLHTAQKIKSVKQVKPAELLPGLFGRVPTEPYLIFIFCNGGKNTVNTIAIKQNKTKQNKTKTDKQTNKQTKTKNKNERTTTATKTKQKQKQTNKNKTNEFRKLLLFLV